MCVIVLLVGFLLSRGPRTDAGRADAGGGETHSLVPPRVYINKRGVRQPAKQPRRLPPSSSASISDPHFDAEAKAKASTSSSVCAIFALPEGGRTGGGDDDDASASGRPSKRRSERSRA